MIHLSLQLMPFPWFTRQHKLYEKSIHFPLIRADVSTIKTSPAYATYLREFLQTNIQKHSSKVFLDLHAVVGSPLVSASNLEDTMHVRLLFVSDRASVSFCEPMVAFRMMETLALMVGTMASSSRLMVHCGRSMMQ